MQPTSAEVFCGALHQQCIVAQKSIHSLARYHVSDKSEDFLDTVQVLTRGYLHISEDYLDTVQVLTMGYLDTVL
jgi:L-fucose isomerase-like protein